MKKKLTDFGFLALLGITVLAVSLFTGCSSSSSSSRDTPRNPGEDPGYDPGDDPGFDPGTP